MAKCNNVNIKMNIKVPDASVFKTRILELFSGEYLTGGRSFKVPGQLSEMAEHCFGDPDAEFRVTNTANPRKLDLEQMVEGSYLVVYGETGLAVPDVMEVDLDGGFLWQVVRGLDGEIEMEGREFRQRRVTGEFRIERIEGPAIEPCQDVHTPAPDHAYREKEIAFMTGTLKDWSATPTRLKVGDMHANDYRVVNAVTGEEVTGVVEVDTEEGWVMQYGAVNDGRIYRIQGSYRLEPIVVDAEHPQRADDGLVPSSVKPGEPVRPPRHFGFNCGGEIRPHSFREFLNRQSREMQDELLGAERADELRESGLLP